MTDYYVCINRKALLDDLQAIICGESIRFYHEKNEDRIRYNHLKKLCNDKLANLTQGQRVDFGGNFDTKIKKLSNPEIPEEKRFITCIKSPISNRHTEFLFNIPLMKSYLDKMRVNPNRSTHHTIEVYKLKEGPIIIEEKLVAKVKRAGQSAFTTLS